MTEFNDIFAYALPTSVYIYCSLGFIGAYALVALRMWRQAPAVEPRWAVQGA
jgi:hypothetical protein